MKKVEFRCRLSDVCGKLDHYWEKIVGSGHAALALRADWREQLARCRRELGFQYVRFHAILCDDVGIYLIENGKPVFSFHNADDIVDFLLSIGMKPFVELSFMPGALASGRKTVFHYRGNVTPPKSYPDWAALIRKLAGHWIERYGAEEVRSWFFEVWNEPNLKSFWPASQAEYFKLYRVTAKALKEVDSRIRVGGPASANNQWIEEFLQFAKKTRTPVDFVSTHNYPTDEFAGEPTEEALSKVRRGILRQWAQDTKAKVGDKPLYYTEWSSSSDSQDPLHDEPYCAAFIIKTLMEGRGLTQGYSYWTFTDVFAESYFQSDPFHGGFGLLNVHGIAKPAYRAYELLHRIGDQAVLVDGIHITANCWVVRGRGIVSILLTNYAAAKSAIEEQDIHVRIETGRAPKKAYVERIDEDHANAKRAWIEMGEPEYLDADALRTLHQASELERQPMRWKFDQSAIHLHVPMPPQSAACVTLVMS